MTLRELKEWINKLPDEFMEFNVVNGEIGFLDTGDPEDDFTYRIDKPVTTLTVDETTGEIIILNDTQEFNNDDILNQINN